MWNLHLEKFLSLSGETELFVKTQGRLPGMQFNDRDIFPGKHLLNSTYQAPTPSGTLTIQIDSHLPQLDHPLAHRANDKAGDNSPFY